MIISCFRAAPEPHSRVLLLWSKAVALWRKRAWHAWSTLPIPNMESSPLPETAGGRLGPGVLSSKCGGWMFWLIWRTPEGMAGMLASLESRWAISYQNMRGLSAFSLVPEFADGHLRKSKGGSSTCERAFFFFSINQWINQSTNLSINRSINQSIPKPCSKHYV